MKYLKYAFFVFFGLSVLLNMYLIIYNFVDTQFDVQREELKRQGAREELGRAYDLALQYGEIEITKGGAPIILKYDLFGLEDGNNENDEGEAN